MLQSTLIAWVFLCFYVTTTYAQPVPAPSSQRPGSLLFYNFYTSDVGAPNQQNTRINMTNLSTESVLVHWFFIDSGTCRIADTFTCLTGRQTSSFLTSDYDPGVTGYAVAVAVNADGLPRDFDFLIGSEYVKFLSGYEANLGAEPVHMFNAAASFLVVPGSGGSQVDLIFDDNGYEKLPSGLAVNNFPSPANHNETMVIINRIGGDLGEEVAKIGVLNGLLYNQVERGFSFVYRAEGCQLVKVLSDSFPRTSPQLTRVITSGTSGWLRIYTGETVNNAPQGGPNDPRAILGAVINRHTMIPVNHAESFNQGHNLHRLTLAPVTKLRMPVLIPLGC